MAFNTDVVAALITLLAGVVVVAILFPPLRHVPGPIVSRFSKIWYIYRVYRGSWHTDSLALHRKYGSVVRYGPRHCSISDLQDVATVYSLGSGGFEKSAWYDGWVPSGDFSLFTSRNNKLHGQARRGFQHMYAMSSVTKLESHVDDCIELLSAKLEQQENQDIDVSWWMWCFTADVIAKMTFSERMGFLDNVQDVEGFFSWLHTNLRWSTMVGQFDGLNRFLYRCRMSLSRLFRVEVSAPTDFFYKYAAGAIRCRTEERDEDDTKNDLLNSLLDNHDANAESFPMRHVAIGVLQNLVAGSDTTAASLTATLFYLAKNPSAMSKVRHEALKTSSPITFVEAQGMPESLRMFSAVGLPLEREVPASGVRLSCSHTWLPGGTVVGVNPWVTHYNRDVFGADAEVWRPERWLEETSKEKLAVMNRSWIPFGLGSRTCIGRHISMLEMSKAVPEILKRFDLKLVDDKASLKATSIWFVLPDPAHMVLTRRKDL